ncbi:MAG: (2Fe-2S)-binding protein [Deltaproteobacteria bacterium]|nr:(2Fe-2S)-binding protein [Deltaproteobacteria bacterium]MBW1943950.1 (2Fe-2S)-binding protein [Deltaproteobacteria bacterium]
MAQVICYCFGYTAKEIANEVKETGRSHIMEKIMAEKKSGGCDCATKNPKGR